MGQERLVLAEILHTYEMDNTLAWPRNLEKLQWNCDEIKNKKTSQKKL